MTAHRPRERDAWRVLDAAVLVEEAEVGRHRRGEGEQDAELQVERHRGLRLRGPSPRRLAFSARMDHPLTPERPLLMVDIDGVISLHGIPPGETVEGRLCTIDGLVAFALGHRRGTARRSERALRARLGKRLGRARRRAPAPPAGPAERPASPALRAVRRALACPLEARGDRSEPAAARSRGSTIRSTRRANPGRRSAARRRCSCRPTRIGLTAAQARTLTEWAQARLS